MRLGLPALFLAAILTASAFADEVSVKRGVEARFDGIKVDSVTRTSYAGLYEIVVGETLFYTDEKVNFVFKGEIIDARSQKNLTEERHQKLSAIKFEDLPLDLAIKQVRGNGKRVVAIFADPFCPYCKNLDRALLRQDDITIYTFLYPILRPESPEKARAIWCAPDRAKAYYDFMLNGREPAAAPSCDAPVDKWLALGQKIGVRATPTSFTTIGERILGARPEELVKLIGEAQK
ncbi:MAG: DsbC family protein [Betaproteobacteria bacterium]|nr:MAG: DsbC family protein [Betaproteobacteria bacterium]